MVHVEQTSHYQSPLQHETRYQHVQSHAAVPVALQEGHEEAKADKHHHVNILEH